jgi:tRNA threonylcarbamoyladenosine biosynthesis protein TsaB
MPSLTTLLLAADTSGRNGSIALARAIAGQRSVDVLEVVRLDGRAFSAQLIPQIAALLQKHGQGHGKNDLSAFAVATGPGSFTGLRVGLAAIKALAETLKKPIVSISILEAIARCSPSRGRVISLLDAGRNEFYVGDYETGPSSADVRLNGEFLLGRREFVGEFLASDCLPRRIVTPDPSVAGPLQSDGQSVEVVEYPNAGAIAQFGWERLQQGKIVLAEDLDANYLRHSTDAKTVAGAK